MNVRPKPTAEENAAGAASAAAPAATDGAAAPAIAAATAADTALPKKPEKAVSEPDLRPAIPRDEHHGRGGRYALVDGKRVPIDEDGKPLPAPK